MITLMAQLRIGGERRPFIGSGATTSEFSAMPAQHTPIFTKKNQSDTCRACFMKGS